MSAKLYYFYGTMNCGKSMILLAKAYNFQERDIPFLIIKSRIDTRDGKDTIHSRSLGDRECVGVDPKDNVLKVVETEMLQQQKNFKWVLVDEAQFLTEKQVDELTEIVDKHNINVMCYGLRTDFKTHLFPGSKRLFEVADTIEELKSTCSCGAKNIYNARIDMYGEIVLEGKQVEVGGEDKYMSMCRKCYKNKKIIKN